MESNYFPHIETGKVITCRIFDAGSKMEFTNNSLKSPKIGKLNIDSLIIPQGLLIHEKNPDQKISCHCPFNQDYIRQCIHKRVPGDVANGLCVVVNEPGCRVDFL